MHGLPDYPALVSLKEMQAQELKFSFRQIDKPQDRKIIQENIEKSTDRIKEYEEKIFGGGEIENVRKALYKYMESERLSLRPEKKAREIKNKKLKVPDPYHLQDDE